jgi:hypothetical protein
MKFTTPAILLAIAAPLLAQSTTPTPTTDWWTAGPPWATTDPAKWSSVYASLVSEGRIPSTLTAAPWPTNGWGPGSGPWGPGGGRGGPGGGGPGHWGGTYSSSLLHSHHYFLQPLTFTTIGPNGPAPFGSSNFGPWSDWSTRSDWRSKPWTAWWGTSACPPTDWPGWTAGPWSTAAPWTTWSGCSAKTTATNVVTTTLNGSAVVGGVVLGVVGGM